MRVPVCNGIGGTTETTGDPIPWSSPALRGGRESLLIERVRPSLKI